jgi:hypothetical protein
VTAAVAALCLCPGFPRGVPAVGIDCRLRLAQQVTQRHQGWPVQRGGLRGRGLASSCNSLVKRGVRAHRVRAGSVSGDAAGSLRIGFVRLWGRWLRGQGSSYRVPKSILFYQGIPTRCEPSLRVQGSGAVGGWGVHGRAVAILSSSGTRISAGGLRLLQYPSAGISAGGARTGKGPSRNQVVVRA